MPSDHTPAYPMTGFLVRDHRLQVPVDWSAPDRFGSIEVFARELVDPTKATEDLPLLVYLQGGPGHEGPRPLGGGWVAKLLEKFRVILLDQRGTGRSSRVDGRVISRFDDASVAADYLACFRGDAIVADAEHLRNTVFGGRQWATLGQSYGGFLTLTYLSHYPSALTMCLVTGGLPPATASAAQIYAATYDRQAARNREFDRQFPDDVATLGSIADLLAAESVTLPDGDPFTVERLQMLGMPFGMSTGTDQLHWQLDTALDADGELSAGFLSVVGTQTAFDGDPLYAALHEAIYHQGSVPGGWAAAAEQASRPGFATSARPLQLTGEVILPWMFDQIRALKPFRAAVDALLAPRDWPVLYDLDRLASNEVPVAAIQYYDDPYVDLDLALATTLGELAGVDHQPVPARRPAGGRRRDPAEAARSGHGQGPRHRSLTPRSTLWRELGSSR